MSKNQNVSKAIEMLEHHQLRKLLEQAKAGKAMGRSDMQLLERLKSDAARMSSDADSIQKKAKRGRPAESRRIAEKIERLILEKLLERQERGEKLTGADYTFLEKVKQATLEKTDTTAAPVKLPLSQRLQECQEMLFERLCWVVESSKSHMARVSSAQALKKWADELEPPLEPYTLYTITPEDLSSASPEPR